MVSYRAATLCLAALVGCAPPSLESAPDSADGAGEVPNRSSSPMWANNTMPGAIVVEGDMAFPADKMPTIAASRTSDVMRWPDGVIPHVIDKDLPQPERVGKAAEEWLKAGIRFVPRTNEADYVKLVPAQGCVSKLGKQGGEQLIHLAPGCGVAETIHEMGHTVGLGHEQSRSDRDDHVTVYLDRTTHPAQFARTNFQALGEYDVTSIMQYDSWSFAKEEGKPTMTTKDGGIITRAQHLSQKDIAGVQTLYAKELAHDNSDLGARGRKITLTWPKKSPTATYSLDIGGERDVWWVAPCIDAGILKRSLSVQFDGSCPSSKEFPTGPLDNVFTFRICWTENDDWTTPGRAQCDSVTYAGEPSVFVGH